LRNAFANTVIGLVQGTQTVSQAFENMARNIAASILQTVIDRALRELEKEIIAIGVQIAAQGLSGYFGGGGATAGGGAGATAGFAFQSGTTGLQHGGIVTRPTMALLGEAGPEAVVPLSQLGGGGVTVNVINQVPNTEIEQKQQRGPNGQIIHDLIVREVRRSLRGGELDRDFADTYSLRRQPVGR
jgi:phage-related minor tail protein